jgi:hypothetical protein
VAPDILWLNGAFGVGKTTVARLLPDRRLVDPERIGFVMRRTLWRGRDYQDVPLWRRLVVRQVRRAARRGPIVVPMTIVRRDVLEDTIGRLEGVRLVALVAPFELIAARVADDTSDVNANPWRLEQLERCVTAFADPAFGEHVDATRPPTEIAEELSD